MTLVYEARLPLGGGGSSYTDAGLGPEDRALMFLETYDRATKQGCA